MKNFLCVGDLMVDIMVMVESEVHATGDTQACISTLGGGAAANVATWLTYLGNESYLCARVGDDTNGDFLLRDLDSYSVSHGKDRAVGEKSGVVVVLVNENGERTMFPDSGSNAGLSSEDLPSLENFDAVYLSGYSLINPKSRANVTEIFDEFRARGLPVLLDPGTVGALRAIPTSLIHEWVSRADILLLNEEEALFVAQEFALDRALEVLIDLTPIVVVKRGAGGVIGQSRGAAPIELPALPSEVIDTTGAGDAFAAGFMSSWFKERDLSLALASGAKSASVAISHVGARPPR
jgi:sugar/nucleoside kinase (ribokinase family)